MSDLMKHRSPVRIWGVPVSGTWTTLESRQEAPPRSEFEAGPLHSTSFGFCFSDESMLCATVALSPWIDAERCSI